MPRLDPYPPEAASELVRRAQRGERAAFDELVRRYRARIFALALHLSGSQSDADDITQDAFLKAYRALGQFAGRSEFFTWIYRITVNRALNVRRARQRKAETSLEDPRIVMAIAADAGSDPHKAAQLRQTYGCLMQALDRLGPEMRTSVVLVALQGMSHEEAAVIQGCSPGTISWRIHKAKSRLRKALEQGPAVQPLPAAAGEAGPGDPRPLSSELQALLQEWGLPLLHPC